MHKRFPKLLLRGGICAVCTTVLVSPAISASSTVQVKDMGTLGGRFTVVADINEVGDAVGYSETANQQIHAFLYTQGQLRDLGTLGGSGSVANAINNIGQITGFALTASGEEHAFVYAAGAMKDLGTTGYTSNGKAINDGGQVAGESAPSGENQSAVLFAGSGTNPIGQLGSSSTSEAIGGQGQVTGTYLDTAHGAHAFVNSGSGSPVDLMPGFSSYAVGVRAMNVGGAVAATFDTGTTLHGLVYVNGKATDLDSMGGDYTVATAISSSGKITGISALTNGERHAFLYSGGSLADLGTLGGNFSVGYALNDQDQVTGQSGTTDGKLHAFVSQQGTMLDIGQTVDGFAAAGTVIESSGTGINRSGQVIGYYKIDTPSDPTLQVTTRSFIASTAQPAAALFQALLTSVIGVGPGQSLESKIQEALLAYLAGNTQSSCSGLNAFQHEVNAQDGKKIEHATALELIQQAVGLTTAIGCSS